MHVFTNRPRSTYDRFFSLKSDQISQPVHALTACNMGDVDEVAPAYYANSVLAGASPDADGNVHGADDREPLAVDFASMQGKHGIKGLYSPSASPTSQTAGGWPSDDDTAPAPPDVSRRDIHIPLRTRWVTHMQATYVADSVQLKQRNQSKAPEFL
jgi:hypothetical protein